MFFQVTYVAVIRLLPDHDVNNGIGFVPRMGGFKPYRIICHVGNGEVKEVVGGVRLVFLRGGSSVDCRWLNHHRESHPTQPL